MGEKLKGPRLEYGFLLDRNVSKVAPMFPAKRSRTIAQVGLLENATDAEIVRKAWDLCLTIVTANGDAFVKEITRFQNQTTRSIAAKCLGLSFCRMAMKAKGAFCRGLERSCG